MVKEKVDWIPAGFSTNQGETDDVETCLELNSGLKAKPENEDSNDEIESTNSLGSSKNDTVSDGSKTFACYFGSCNKNFVSQQCLHVHYKEQHSDCSRPFPCPLCQAKFKRKTHLEDHISSHTGETRYSCKDCGKNYAKAKSLIHHRKIHHAYKPAKMRRNNNPQDNQFKCNFCPKAFKHRPSLNFHVKTHYDKLSFVCEVCDARFANEQGKLVHKGKYHPVNPYKLAAKNMFSCTLCPRFFEQRGYLTQHMRFIHHMERDDQRGSEDVQSVRVPDNTEAISTDENLQPVTVKFEVEDSDLL